VRRRGLGKGLGALFPDEQVERERVDDIPIGKITPNPRQPRRSVDEGAVSELADSIREHGVIQPIVVRPRGEGYELVAGERRWRAARLAGLQSVPAIVRDLTDGESMEIALIENLQREDLNPIEEALAYRALMDEFGLTQEEIARRVGKSRPRVANALRLLNLPQGIRERVEQGGLTPGHALAVLSLESAEEQEGLADRIESQGLTVRAAEKEAGEQRKGRGRRRPDRPAEERPVDVRVMEEELRRLMQTKVEIHARREGGRIEIEFYNVDDLERLAEGLRAGFGVGTDGRGGLRRLAHVSRETSSGE